MKNHYHVIFLHGALHGGWCWQPLLPFFKHYDEGCYLYTPTLAGLGEKQHLLSKDLNLSTHIEQIAELVESIPSNRIFLVAHSYGALIALALNERFSEKVTQVILVDGLICEKDNLPINMWPLEQRQQRLEEVVRIKNVPCFDVAPASVFGIDDINTQEWVNRLLTPHPVSCYLEPMPLKQPLINQKNICYIECVAPTTLTAQVSLEYIHGNLNWPVIKFEAGHDAMLINPQLLAKTLGIIFNFSRKCQLGLSK